VLAGLRFLPADSLSELAGAMLAVPALESPGGRQAVLNQVRQWSPAFSPRRSDVDAEEVRCFITACQLDDISFDLLLDAVAIQESADDPDLSRLHDLVETTLPRAALTKSDLRDLLALYPDSVIQGTLLERGMCIAGPEWADAGRYALAQDVRDAVLLLLNASAAADGLRRVVRFASWMADVAHAADSALENGLRGWVARIATAHGLPAADCRPPGAKAQAEEPTLLVELTPATPGLFAVHPWLKVPGADFRRLAWEAEPCPLDELRHQADALLDLANAELIGVTDELQVEFLLGLDNIDHDVDWWPVEAQSVLPRPLGAVYKVAVRRRSSTNTELRAWDAWWRAIKRAAAPARELAVLVADTEVSAKNVWNQFSGKDRILIAPLAERMGLPVALCERGDPADAAGQLAALREELGSAAVADLPALVRQWRHDAFMADYEHFGRRLVLLWDDYDRPPPGPGEKLRYPTMKGTQ
jgi:hypothetical protein